MFPLKSTVIASLALLGMATSLLSPTCSSADSTLPVDCHAHYCHRTSLSKSQSYVLKRKTLLTVQTDDFDINRDCDNQCPSSNYTSLEVFQINNALAGFDGNCGGAPKPLQGWDDGAVSTTQRYVTALQEAAWGKVFFITECGYISLGLLSSFAGDDVVVLCGGKTPYGLLSRDQESASFHLIGEVYVRGLMEGEAFQETVQAKAIALV
ncbi:hypothetical protein L207DRAFT_610847 [Hyaloscypha variabilis F]|uniref:Ecp2 effector protein domain-containing protein n=1 Tax=Hyaloscypha variabilis (strain UAMH 11265 / GT02V1 / F) TaxID=1149755 RepID=A0A2J6QZ00_HYAVF|nr:hypothetical protein L207DRAFT_610847 [Hyaloscypha variabilis F]